MWRAIDFRFFLFTLQYYRGKDFFSASIQRVAIYFHFRWKLMRPNQMWRIFVNNEKKQVNGKKWLKWKTKVLKSIALLLGVIANIAELNQHNWSRTSHISMNFARNANIKCQSTWFSPMSESSANRFNRVWEGEQKLYCILAHWIESDSYHIRIKSFR